MILTGKAKIDFGDYIINKHNIASWNCFNKMSNILKNALIIDFFNYSQIWNVEFFKEFRKTAFMDYNYACIEAIKKCNEIYNKK